MTEVTTNENTKNKTKFSEEELKQVQEIREEYFKVQQQLGSLAMTKKRLDFQYDDLAVAEEELNVRFMKNREIENNFIENNFSDNTFKGIVDVFYETIESFFLLSNIFL